MSEKILTEFDTALERRRENYPDNYEDDERTKDALELLLFIVLGLGSVS